MAEILGVASDRDLLVAVSRLLSRREHHARAAAALWFQLDADNRLVGESRSRMATEAFCHKTPYEMAPRLEDRHDLVYCDSCPRH